MEELAFRQVHLDFHTSGEIAGVGADFDPQEFVATLKAAHVNSVTCFAKCHHGYSYYPTEVGVRHPHLTRDLLGEQVEACHAAGIRIPAYVSVVWDEHAAATHQEWLQVDREGKEVGRPPLGTRGWRSLCMNTAYADYVAAQTEEVLKLYPVDGIFFDIVREPNPGCVCNTCRAKMAERGIDPADDAALRAYDLSIERDFMHRMTALVHHLRPEASVFYNSRLRVTADVERGVRPELPYYTHVEIESLPSGAWGYNHYPLFVRYFQPLGKDLLGMTARFHKSWADFGGLKNRAALEYECFAMLATGAKCSIGDQLHPRGRLERPAYDLIGSVFGSVEAKEPWCRGTVPLAEIGVILAQGQPGVPEADGRDTDEGIMRMLLESGRQFQFVDAESDFEDYALLVLPDSVRVGPALAVKLRDFLSQGGRLLATGESGLDPTGDHFAVKELGVKALGPSPWATAFLRADEHRFLRHGVPHMDHVVYERGWSVAAEPDAHVLAWEVPPYFNRTHLHFNSHAQTPPAVSPGAPLPADARPAAVQHGHAIYFSQPLCRAYRRGGNRVYRQLIAHAIEALLPDRLIEAGLPSNGQATLLQQPEEGGRLIAHLLYYVPERRTPTIDVIEDVVPLHGVDLAVRTGFHPRRVYEAPSGKELPFTWHEGVASVVVERVEGHAMVVFEP